jgi:hypothetical protein
VGVGSAPAENLLRDITEKSGGACEFVTPNENMAAVIVRMFRRMRGAAANRLKISWGQEALWQSPLPMSIFDGETLHLFAGLAQQPEAVPVLSWEIDGQTQYAKPESIQQTDNQEMVRLGAAQRMIGAGKEDALNLALKYQLVSSQTSLFLVYLREGEDKVTELPTVQQVPQMMTAGSHGYGSVTGMDAVRACFAVPLVPLKAAYRDKNDVDIVVQPDSPPSAWSPQALLERFDQAVLGNQDFKAFLQASLMRAENHELRALVERLSQQEGISLDQTWAVLLDWLLDKLSGDFTSSRQARRLLRAQLKTIDAACAANLQKAFAAELPAISLYAWAA